MGKYNEINEREIINSFLEDNQDKIYSQDVNYFARLRYIAVREEDPQEKYIKLKAINRAIYLARKGQNTLKYMYRFGKNHHSYKHGLSKTKPKLYRLWSSMSERTTNPNHHAFHRYGGRGITICDEWRYNVLIFIEWALSHGYKEGLQIDRIDNDKGYSPNNCRFVTPKVNSNNRDKRINYGIYYRKDRSHFRISLERDNKSYYGGSAKTIEEARILRNNLEKKLQNV